MFRYMGHTGIIPTGRPKPNGKDFVVILGSLIKKKGPTLLMDHILAHGLKYTTPGDSIHAKAMDLIIQGKLHIG